MVTDAQKKAMKKYDAKTKQYVFRMRLNADADIIERLDSVSNKAAYFRGLVRDEIEESVDQSQPR